MCREGRCVSTHILAHLAAFENPNRTQSAEPRGSVAIPNARELMTPKKKLSDIVKDMTALKKTWANTKPAPDIDNPIPPGEYACDLTDGSAFEAKTGSPGYKITLKVKEGEFAGRLVWHDFYLSEKALPYTMRALAKIGITDLEQLDNGFPTGLVVKAKIVVNKRDDGSERNEVRSWELVAVAEDANPTPPQPETPPAPAPWSVDLNTLDTDTPKGDEQ